MKSQPTVNQRLNASRPIHEPKSSAVKIADKTLLLRISDVIALPAANDPAKTPKQIKLPFRFVRNVFSHRCSSAVVGGSLPYGFCACAGIPAG
jgi:hypothetical protein